MAIHMKILKIIHGYPPLYNAGSEVYSQLLCQGLAKKHEIHVITREENPFAKDFSVQESTDSHNSDIRLYKFNIPLEKFRYRFYLLESDKTFSTLLKKINPDIVHIGHLNHLSTSWVEIIYQQKIPMIYTLHDYWLMCPRGQFIQRNTPATQESWAVCNGQEDRKCAEKCYAGYFTGQPNEIEQDVHYWTDWVHRRMVEMKNITKKINLFIAPARYLYNRFCNEFQLPKEKLIYLDYGFDLSRLQNRKRLPGEPFTFGYIGTHIPAKGIHDLLLAFGKLKGNCKLRIWGRYRSQFTDGLHAIAASLPNNIQDCIEWKSEYQNENIVNEVFNHTDCVVVPSIWVENSPLVIHEALQLRIPVITADVGGMAEYVHHEKNGLLFEHRNIESLAFQMQRLVDDPTFAKRLGNQGYLQSPYGNIPDLETHVQQIEKFYDSILLKGAA